MESRFVLAYNLGTISLRFGDERYQATIPRSTCLDTSSTNSEKLKKFKLNQRLLRDTKYKFSKVPEFLETGSETSSTPVKMLGRLGKKMLGRLGKKIQNKNKSDADDEDGALAKPMNDGDDEPTKSKPTTAKKDQPKENTDEEKGILSRNGQYFINLSPNQSRSKVRKFRSWLYELMKQNQVTEPL